MSQHTRKQRALTLDRLFHMRNTAGQLPHEEEQRIIALAQNGNKKAIEAIISNHIPFVSGLAHQFADTEDEKDDYIQAGNLGILEAIKRYNKSLGFKFLSYAVWWVRRYMLNAQKDMSGKLKYSQTLNRQRRYIQLSRKELASALGYAPSDEQLAEHLSMTVEMLQETLTATTTPTSLDQQFDDSDAALLDMLAAVAKENPERNLQLAKIRQLLGKYIDDLPTIQQEILRLWLGWDNNHSISLQDAAKRVSLSYEKTRSLKDLALRKIRVAIQHNKEETILRNVWIPTNDTHSSF